MAQLIWELKVKFKEREKFEKFYGPKGEWEKFFRKCPDYEGSEILGNNEGDGLFLLIDEWKSEDAFDAFIKSKKPEYDALEEKAKAASRTKNRIRISLNPEE